MAHATSADDVPKFEKDWDCVLDLGQERVVNLDQEEECGSDPELDPDCNCQFDPDLDPDWNAHHVVSWDERVVEALHLVRLYEITEDDPVNGTVLVRDQFDYKCMHLFKRDKDNAQVIRSKVNLKVIRCDDCGETDFSKGVIERDVFVSGPRRLFTRQLTSWHSTVQLAYTPVPSAVAAKLAVNILEGPRDIFTGEVSAWTSGNKNRIILYDSKVEGTETSIGDGGSVMLSRCLVAVPVKEDLQVRVWVREGDCEAARFELTLDHLDDDRICFQGSYEIQVKVEWTAIMDRSEKGVLRHIGHTILLV